MANFAVNKRSISNSAEPLNLLRHCPVYHPTPIVERSELGLKLGWSSLTIKSESNRMGLGSFKALGGAYAVFCLVIEKLEQILGKQTPIDELIQTSRLHLSDHIVCCASAGNHGLSVAAGAELLGLRCEVFLSDNVPDDFAKRLLEFGATVIREGESYEISMAAAKRRAVADDVTLITDSSWQGETHYPTAVMQGYSVMAEEMSIYFASANHWPTHVALQAGVGGFAAAITQYIRDNWPVQPQIMVVEPEWAGCLKQSIERNQLVRAEGPASNMGRLDCKEPSMIAFDILKEAADRFITISEQQALSAVQILTDYGIQTTTSGAAGLAGLMSVDLNTDAMPMIIITE